MRLPTLGISALRAAVLVTAPALLAAAAGLALYREEARAERAVFEGRAEVLAEAMERSLTEAMTEHRPESMAAILAAVARTEGVAAVALADAAGRVRHAAGDAPATIPLARGVRWAGARVVVESPIANGAACRACHLSGAVNGAVHVTLDAAALGPRLLVAARRTALAAALGALALAAVLVLAARGSERNARLREALAEATQAREARAADLQKLQAILDSMVDGVLFIDTEDEIALVNKAGRMLRNLTGGPGRPIRDCHPKASQAVLDRVLGYLRSGDDAGAPHSIIKEREGRFETTYAPVRGPDGAYAGTVMVTRDIAERRTLERRLLDAERLSGLGQMSAQIAHELRNPLNAIDGAAQYLRRRLADDADVAEYAGLIGEEVQRVNRFITELLGIARPAEPSFAPVSVNRLAKDAAQRATVARGLPADAVRLDLASDLPVLDVDAPMIVEALLNLLQNAFDAGGVGPVELETRYDAVGGEGTIAVEVRDRGCGIPAEDLEEVLRPFVTTKANGTGLGLVVVTRAVEQHRARFALAPRDGGGTVAAIRFPVRRLASPAPQDVA